MKSSLPERSLIIQDRLDKIVEQILAIRKGKIAMVILFGSYARGDWVSDEYVENGITYSYQSDIDLLIVLRQEDNARGFALRMEDQIERRLEYKGIEDPLKINEPLVSLVIETIGIVNRNLEKGQYFYSDIKREGVFCTIMRNLNLLKLGSWKEKKGVRSLGRILIIGMGVEITF